MAATVTAVERRAAYTAGLRRLADLLDQNPGLPLPADGDAIPLGWGFYGDDARAAMAAAARAIPCAWRKQASGDYFSLAGDLAGLRLMLTAGRDAVCTRRVTGTREIIETVPDPAALAAVPTVEVTRVVEDAEWDCGSLLAPDPVPPCPVCGGHGGGHQVGCALSHPIPAATAGGT